MPQPTSSRPSRNVRGAAARSFQPKAFGVVKGGNWNVIGSQGILVDGFVAGATNTIVFKGDLSHSAPDLDWIEVE